MIAVVYSSYGYGLLTVLIVITYFCISNIFIIIEDFDIISSRPTNTAIPLIAPVLISLLVHVLVHSVTIECRSVTTVYYIEYFTVTVRRHVNYDVAKCVNNLQYCPHQT